MSEHREFIVHRYASAMWPQVTGMVPFIATGPKFHSFVVHGSLFEHKAYKFKQELQFALEGCFPAKFSEVLEGVYGLATISEFLLREGIVQAFWCHNPKRRFDVADDLQRAINQLALEIPLARNEDGNIDLPFWTIETLSGMSGQEFWKSYISEDGLTLEPIAVVPC